MRKVRKRTVPALPDRAPDRELRCAFCAWTTLVWLTTTTGKRVSGWPALAAHVQDCHPEVVFDAVAVASGEGEVT